MLTYPAEFVDQVEAEYWDRPDVVESAREHRYTLGKLLADGANPEIAADPADPSFLRRRSLHAEWMRIVVREISVAKDRVSSTRWPRPRIRASTTSRPSSAAPSGA